MGHLHNDLIVVFEIAHSPEGVVKAPLIGKAVEGIKILP